MKIETPFDLLHNVNIVTRCVQERCCNHILLPTYKEISSMLSYCEFPAGQRDLPSAEFLVESAISSKINSGYNDSSNLSSNLTNITCLSCNESDIRSTTLLYGIYK
ncbi:hypothetical protein Glove_709g18 [Diversispora epigaea]|uniref:Uncharacterized protein n=1 Tax=Diversispora epigaea TaxID=1348612 RepID=A0A397G167_9GLOM|nr:hypothetical protein Glove_709g18 [Diversispora epigaea]